MYSTLNYIRTQNCRCTNARDLKTEFGLGREREWKTYGKQACEARARESADASGASPVASSRLPLWNSDCFAVPVTLRQVY